MDIDLAESEAEEPRALDEHEAAFERFGEMMDLDFDVEAMDDDDRASFEGLRRTVLAALRKGLLTIDERGQPVFQPTKSKGGPITFREPTGDTFLEMDRAKKGRSIMALNLAMAQVTRQAPPRFAKMANRDLKVCHAIMNLFLG